MVDPRRIELHQKLREITLGTHPDIAASGVANEAPFPPTPFSVDTLNPLLAREKWVVEEPIWELLMPVVNLASAIFESEASFIFVYSVINAEPRRDTELSEKFGKDIYFIRKLDPCSTRRPIDQVREESSSNLEYIEREIQFSFFDKRHEYWAAKPAINGSCRGRRNRPTSFSNHARKNIEGRYSKIFIRGDLLDELKHLRSIHPATPKLAHAVGWAVHRDMAEEPIWEDHQLAELGRVWEQEVHGASLEYGASLSATAGILWAAKWPDFAAGVRYRKKTQVGKFKGLSTRYAVPMPYIHLVSSMEFRRKYRGSRNPKLVWFPKIYGINFESLRQNLTLGRYGDDDVIGRQAWDHQIPELEEWFRNWDRLRKEAVGDADRKAVLEGDDESISSLWPVHGEDLRAK